MQDPIDSGSIRITPEGEPKGQDDTSFRASHQPDIVADAGAGVIAGETLEQIGAGASTGEIPSEIPLTRAAQSTGKSAFLVGTGILISRIVGLIRQRIFAHYFGRSGEADAFSAAFRIPNFLQNGLREDALSASFIPAYAKHLSHDAAKEDARG